MAPPEFPGRDPHHWAIYRGAKTYGVTCHVMTDRVDEGAIVAVERFPIVEGMEPKDLCTGALPIACDMFELMLPGMHSGNTPRSSEKWGNIKTKRADSILMRGQRGFESF